MLLKDMLKGKSKASYVEYGYGQVEPNHLSAQRNGQIYAQLPADPAIDQLEQGQFVKYDYANGLVNFTGKGEWMLVFNEIKLYRDNQWDCEFAMLKDNYVARVYSPIDGLQVGPQNWANRSRTFNGIPDSPMDDEPGGKYSSGEKKGQTVPGFEKVTASPDMYELHYEEDPFHFESKVDPALMPAGATMVPRVFKTMVGDIFTTNTINETELALGEILSPAAENGILSKSGDGSMEWQVVKVYNLPDYQKAVKIMRIK